MLMLDRKPQSLYDNLNDAKFIHLFWTRRITVREND